MSKHIIKRVISVITFASWALGPILLIGSFVLKDGIVFFASMGLLALAFIGQLTLEEL